MSLPADHPTGVSDNLLRLPVRVQRFNLQCAAIYLGISPLRLRVMGWFGAGPVPSEGRLFRTDDLDRYIAHLYETADISAEEMQRRRQARADQRGAALMALTQPDARSRYLPPPGDPFMTLATRNDIMSQSVFIVLKALALFGLIMLCLSISPLLKTSF